MIVQYKPNEKDRSILEEITGILFDSLEQWYGKGAILETRNPEIRSYRNCFILRYPVTTPDGRQMHILVKIRRNPKMASIHQTVGADIHQNIPTEYQSLKFAYEHQSDMQASLCAIRPLIYIDRYCAIAMEEFPSQTLRQLLNIQRSSKTQKALDDVKDAARKTGRWLWTLHHRVFTPVEKLYTTEEILLEVKNYAERIETASRGRVSAGLILEAFADKLEGLEINRVPFSQTHADMTCDNVLYSDDQRVCVIDIKTRLAPVYADLGLILIHPETSRLQIFSGGRYYSDSLLRQYREQITAGYFDEETGSELLVRIYSAIKVLDKWLMYEDLMRRYKGMKRILSRPAVPFVSRYFQNLMKKYLDMIRYSESIQMIAIEETSIDTTV